MEKIDIKNWIGKNILITTDNWFISPNGQQCNSVWGTLHGCYKAEDTLGIKVNSRSTDWYVSIGNMIIAGCQVHYAMLASECSFKGYEGYSADAQYGIKKYPVPNAIYNANE
jgi:hypothetical protein